MTLAQVDQIVDRGDDSSPSRAVFDQNPGQIRLKLIHSYFSNRKQRAKVNE